MPIRFRFRLSPALTTQAMLFQEASTPMIYRELAILLPCHSLEDFPLYHSGDDADSLLACWTALWHPALVAAAGSGPKWHRVDLPPEDLQEKLLLVPTISVSQLPTGFGQRAKEAGAILIRQEKDRAVILQKALAALDGGDAGLDGDLVQDFLALGYAYLQIQILTRQMRYSCNLDEVHFFNQLVAGASAAVAGNADEARAKVAACFDLLAEERDHYYSVDACLIDLTLVAETTIGETLRAELSRANTLNVLIAGEVLAALEAREPQSLQALRTALAEQRIGVLGGEESERPWSLLPCEDLLAGLRRGREIYRRVLGEPVVVFGRRRFGLTPFLPGILEKLGYTGALHATLDEGRFPGSAQVKTRWQGVDAGAVDAIAKPPLDATKPETFLNFAQKLGESMDSDHVATLCLAHWPGQASVWYDDLRRCARFTPALGKFLTVGHYFENTYRPGNLDRFELDRYKSPYLKQAVIRKHPDPISSIVRSWRRRVAADVLRSLQVMAAAVRGGASNLTAAFDDTVEPVLGDRDEARDAQQAAALRQAVEAVGELLPRQGAERPGCLILNPLGFSRRVGVAVPFPTPPNVAQPVVAAGSDGTLQHVVVDVPSMGYSWIEPGVSTASSRKKAGPALAEDEREKRGVFWLRNEFFEIAIDPVTGALKSLNDYQSRQNRLSQQLALRFPGTHGQAGDVWRDPDETAQYSVMAADEIAVTHSDAAVGEIRTAGRLLDREGTPVAKYTQHFRVCRGSRVLRIDVELEPLTEPTSDVWNSYYACRFAWNDEAAQVFVSANQTRQEVSKQRLEAPLYIDVESGDARTTILTGGLPFHRRVGGRMLDSLLIVRGERERRFQLGIGIDLPQSLPEALGLLAPEARMEQTAGAPVPPQSWLFHCDVRSVVATSWSLIAEGGQVRGLRVRFLESTGRSGRFKLSAFRPFASGRQVNFVGETLSECPVTDGQIQVDIAAHEWIEVEGRWN